MINKEIPVNRDITLTESIAIPKVNKGYTLWLPDDGRAEGMIVFTHDKGYQQDGSRHPHTWNIVDEKELVDWFIALIK